MCIKGVIKENSCNYVICGVCRAHVRQEKAQVWKDLEELKKKVNVSTIFLGDFNGVLQADERKGGVSQSRSSREFR